MKRQGSPVILALALSLLATNAWADGWEGKHPLPLLCTAPFAGAYFGIAAGYVQQRAEIDNLTLGTEFDDREGSFTFGGYTGYNWQRCGHPLVFGIEADFNYINTSPTAFDIETGPTALTETTSLESSIDWLGTVRGRAGYVVHDRLLLYATGGLAYANFDHTLSDDCVGCGNSVFNLGPFSQSNSGTKAGWTVGGGAELLHDSHWLLRAEALYVDLGSETHTYVLPTPVATANADTKWDDQLWLARLGISYKFGERERVVPLK